MRHILLLVTLLARAAAAQGIEADVEKACTSPRLGIRIAAARKVASGGDAAVPAIRAFASRRGKDMIPVSLVDAIADGADGGGAVAALLEDWAVDREFFWRGQAMRGLARRAPRMPEERKRLLALFDRHAQDPAWLTRVFARLGREMLRASGDVGEEPPPERDPRAASKLVAYGLRSGLVLPLQPLFDALADERTFLGDPWGRRRAMEALAALREWLGDDGGVRLDAPWAERERAVAGLLERAAKKSGQRLAMPVPRLDQEIAVAGGIETFSCRNGDFFLRFTPNGTCLLGLEGEGRAVIEQETWERLDRERSRVLLPRQSGVVICDRMRVVLEDPDIQGYVAPRSMPAPVLAWLRHLAGALQESGAADAAAALRDRLGQFAAP
ncbi:MAG: hypothetical protein Fur0037_14980 [Planctomycetota bacterium]